VEWVLARVLVLGLVHGDDEHDSAVKEAEARVAVDRAWLVGHAVDVAHVVRVDHDGWLPVHENRNHGAREVPLQRNQ